MKIHIIEPQETLFSIANLYGVPMAQLISDNQLPDPSRLAIGQAILVRFPQKTYTVLAGDTLSSIAKKHNQTIRQLWRNNPALLGSSAIFAGQILVLEYADTPTRSILSYGYGYPSIEPNLFRSTLPSLSAVAPFTHAVTADGGLQNLDDDNLVAEAIGMGTAPILHVSTLVRDIGFSGSLARSILTSSAAQRKLIAQIKTVALEGDYRGVDLDFESVFGSDAEGYAAFVTALRETLAPYNLSVIVALAPKTSADQRGEQYEGHNYKLLGQAADYLLLMTYEWGYRYSPPMAVAPIGGVRQVVEYAVSEIPAGKLLLGLPNYGYNWTLPHIQGRTAASIGCQEAISLAIQTHASIRFDDATQTPWFRYSDQYGTEHEVWFEDPRSVVAKLQLVARYGLGGVGYWNLDRPFPQTYAVLNSYYHVTDFSEKQ